MKKFFMDLLKSKNTARKASAIAIIVTALLLAAALLTLSVFLIASSLKKNDGDVVDNSDTVRAPETVLAEIEAFRDSQLSFGEDVAIKEARSKHPDGGANHYYASYNVSVPEVVQKHLDAMLVAHYNANKAVLICDTEDDDNCNIPTVRSADKNGMRLLITDFDDNSTSYDSEWLKNNAAKYGFICENSYYNYVGVPHAEYMTKNGYKTVAAYIEALGDERIRFTATDAIGGVTSGYEVYYISSDEALSVPTNYEYTVFAYGTTGYIIAADLSKEVT